MSEAMQSIPRPPSVDELVTDDGEPMESDRHVQQMVLLIETPVGRRAGGASELGASALKRGLVRPPAASLREPLPPRAVFQELTFDEALQLLRAARVP